MRLVAIETATTICGIGYFFDGKCIRVIEKDITKAHAEQLPVYFDQLIKEENIQLKDIDAIAVSIGPGSFTGLRIGLSYAKGIAFSHGLPIIPVPTLLGIAQGITLKEDSAVMLHSHSDIYFYQQFLCKQNGWVSVEKPVAISMENLQEIFTNNKNVYVYGNEKQFNTIKDFDFYKILPSVKWIGKLAEKFSKEWIEIDPINITPEYISPFQIRSS